ncbi:MAG: cytochrome c maturation protein CcmE [Bacteroidia bacterium]|nr:cytochrome c maturation protein CcmE [Bacteroidia bacterium]MDW8346113.1 cytochrome c maturation protein CcmE [Bacteroidia bacterium]
MNKKWTIIIILVVVASFGFMLYSMTSNSSEYTDFATAKLKKKEVHIAGEWVMRDKTDYDPVKNPNLFAFYLKDEKGQTAKVIYKDSKPVGFEESQKVVIIGTWQGEYFEASKIMMKCPSKYNDGVKPTVNN